MLKVCVLLSCHTFHFANKLTVRTTRARIIHLRNDYKALVSKLELGLHDHHAAYQASQPALASTSSQPSGNSAASSGIVDAPFAKVNSIVTGSPVDQAGLKTGDRIRKFENVNFMNHERLSKVAEAVQRNKGVSPARTSRFKVTGAEKSTATFTG